MNRAERRKMQKNFGNNIANVLKEAVEKSNENTEESSVFEEDLNILPLPIQQIVENTYMMWVWVPMNGVQVFGKLFTKHEDGFSPGDWVVEMAIPEINAESYLFTDDAPKLVGQALVSAWNYKNIWKQHAGDFLERQLMTMSVIAGIPEEDAELVPITDTDFATVEVIEAEEDDDEEEGDGTVGDYPVRPPVELTEFQKTYTDVTSGVPSMFK
jgi:hypothetical protein